MPLRHLLSNTDPRRGLLFFAAALAAARLGSGVRGGNRSKGMPRLGSRTPGRREVSHKV